MPRGRPSRTCRVRNTCAQCRVFIATSLTHCAQCSRQQDSSNATDDASVESDILSGSSLPSPAPTPQCSLCQNNHTENGSLGEQCRPISLNDPTSVECQKCRRIPPENLRSHSVRELKKTKFGCSLSGLAQQTVNLCAECALHTSKGSTLSWSNAWPSVILDFLRGKFNGTSAGRPFHKLLPLSISSQYEHLFHSSIQTSADTTFDDLTPKLSNFKDLKRELKIENVMEAHNKYCFPEIRCPFGCTEFVGDSGLVPLQYFLQTLDQNFKFGTTNWKRKLRCVRPDWMEETIHNDMFKIKPHVVLNPTKGLCLATCRFHDGGSNKFFVHRPTNPTGRLPSKYSDRLGPATITYNCMKPTKPNYSTHTYSMGIAKGNFAGISSTTIGTKRKWDVAFGKDDVCKESLCCNYRDDIKLFLQTLVGKGELSQDLAESIGDKGSLPSSNDVQKCLKSSTSVPFDQALALKKIQERGIDVKYFPLFAQPLNKYGCHPPDLNITGCQQLHLWVLGTMFSLSTTFHSSLLTSTVPSDKVVQDLSALLLSNNGVPPNKKTKSNLTLCMNSMFPSSSTDFVSSLREVLESVSVVKNVSVETRDILEGKLQTETSPLVTFTTSSRCGTHSSFLPDVVLGANGDRKYELRSITVFEGSTVKTLVRHGLKYDRWWMFTDDCNHAVEIEENDLALMTRFHSNWTCCHYELTASKDLTEDKIQYLEYLGGQGRFVCQTHQIPLTVTNKNKTCTCSLTNDCVRQAAWQCPSDGCLSGVCRTHYKLNINSDGRINVKPAVSDSNLQRRSTDEDELLVDNSLNETNSDVSDAESSYDEFAFVNFATDSGAIENIDNLGATDSGDVPVLMDSKDDTIPTHVLLNSDCHVLQRHRFRNDRNKKSSRFLQNIVASTPATSIPLLYPDGALFPTHYYHEQEDRTITGALPSPLFNEKQSKDFNFASIDDHKRSTILNPDLVQSTDVRSIQTAFDTVFNKQLNLTDTRLVLNRGFQEVNSMKSKSIASENTRLQFDKADSRVRVNELASLLSDEPATFFLTLTCNQKEHFGVSPIFEALEKKFDRNCKEEWDRAVQAEIVLLTRAWYRAAEALMEWIEKSPDKPLGTVTKLWYRYEFQTTKGNLPHIHAVIWTKESKEELKIKVVCASNSALFEFKLICEETNVIRKEDLPDLMDQLMKIQTHSCEKASFRCHKVTKADGSSICRVPRYPFATRYSWRKVPSCHSEEALEKLHHLDLAVPSVTQHNTFEVRPVLQGGKFEYPASSDEHLSPFSPLIFAATRSSQNLQLCDEYLSARYIAKYAAGIEESECKN